MFKILMLSKITITLTTFVNNTDNVHDNDLANYFSWKGNIYVRKNSVATVIPCFSRLQIFKILSESTESETLPPLMYVYWPIFTARSLCSLVVITYPSFERSSIGFAWRFKVGMKALLVCLKIVKFSQQELLSFFWASTHDGASPKRLKFPSIWIRNYPPFLKDNRNEAAPLSSGK